MLKNSSGYLAALIATAVWAGNFVAARALAGAIPPVQFNFWRWAIAFLVMLPFGLGHLRGDLRHCQGHWRYLAIMAFLGVTLMNTFVYKAGQSAESLNMALIMPATPAVIMILARIFYAEPIPPRRLLGMLCASIGIVTLISRGSLERLLSLSFTPGDLWTLGGMLCFAVYSLLMRQRPTDLSSAGFNIVVFGLGLVFCLPLLFWEVLYFPLPKPGWDVAIGIGYSSLGCSALAFWLWTVAIDRVGPVRSGIIYYSLPFFAAVMGRLILNEQIITSQIWGGALIIGGILLATWPKHEN